MKILNKAIATAGIALIGISFNASAIEVDNSRGYGMANQSTVASGWVPVSKLVDHTVHALGYSDIRE